MVYENQFDRPASPKSFVNFHFLYNVATDPIKLGRVADPVADDKDPGPDFPQKTRSRFDSLNNNPDPANKSLKKWLLLFSKIIGH